MKCIYGLKKEKGMILKTYGEKSKKRVENDVYMRSKTEPTKEMYWTKLIR